jgi:hypothetical protein
VLSSASFSSPAVISVRRTTRPVLAVPAVADGEAELFGAIDPLHGAVVPGAQ